MSIRLVEAVATSDLPAWLRPYAQAFARYAKDDGTQLYPSVGRIAREVGKQRRQTHTAIAELRVRGILVPLERGGRHKAVSYWFNAEALPRLGDGDQLPLWGKLGRKKAFPQAERVDS